MMAAMERPSEIIPGEDFVLRRWQESDLKAAFTLIRESADHLLPWMPWVAEHTEQNTRDFLAKAEARWTACEVFNYAVVKDGTPVGMCQAYSTGEPPSWRLGYWLHPAATGQGIATRATAALVTEMFTLPDVDYLEISHDRANVPSSAVPRRLGFTQIRHEQQPAPTTPPATGIEVIWRLNRPKPASDPTPAP